MDIAKVIKLEPGHYVVAVSGGVDSMVLLDLLAKLQADRRNDTKFTVAHFDHGIRDDSHIDRTLVQEIAQKHSLPFVYGEGNLGKDASEAEARAARYEFLRKVQGSTGAHRIITAHHHDDMVETAILNLLRGTGRKGMTSLKVHHEGVVRPLLHVPKNKLKSYAEANGLTWHEDSTNTNQDYKRNYVRHSIIKKAKAKNPREYKRLIALLRRQRELNHAIDNQLELILHTQASRDKLSRQDVATLPYRAATELVAEWLRQNGKRTFNRWIIERLTVAIRTARPGTEMLLDSSCKVSFGKQTAEFRIV